MSQVGPWVRDAVECALSNARQIQAEHLKEIQYHQEQVEWRQAALETVIDRISELAALLNDGKVSGS